MTLEDQLTVQRNWNLHPNNPNPDMIGLKDTYKSGEESNLGKTGQVQSEINRVTNPVQKALVTYAATNPTPTFVTECKDTLNLLGYCYGCNKPEHVKKDCRIKTELKPKLGAAITEDREEKLSTQDYRGTKKNYRRDNPRIQRR